ncbi:hypothetical protein [Catenulispora subtropica]|uniref:Uncharacterized protein n=1 Tax=Catenulispora subtropica TaxID=450798 RepID=A0ABN2R7A3_9ACTN
MGRIADWLLARIVPTTEAAAGCSTTRVCQDCPYPRAYLGQLKTTTCCLNEGCSTSYSSCGSC